jgi:hypothetical protein
MNIWKKIKLFLKKADGMTDEDNVVVIKDIKKVKTMKIYEKKWIKKEFEKGNALRFYRSSGTAVLTNAKPKDFEELYYVPRDMIPEITENPEILNKAISRKKEKKESS